MIAALFQCRLAMDKHVAALPKLVIPPFDTEDNGQTVKKPFQEVPSLLGYYRALPYYGKVSSSYGVEIITDGISNGVDVKHNPRGKKYAERSRETQHYYTQGPVPAMKVEGGARRNSFGQAVITIAYTFLSAGQRTLPSAFHQAHLSFAHNLLVGSGIQRMIGLIIGCVVHTQGLLHVVVHVISEGLQNEGICVGVEHTNIKTISLLQVIVEKEMLCQVKNTHGNVHRFVEFQLGLAILNPNQVVVEDHVTAEGWFRYIPLPRDVMPCHATPRLTT